MTTGKDRPDMPVILLYDKGLNSKHSLVNLPEENPLTIFLNGKELVTLMCTPSNKKSLIAGYLYTEGIIDSTYDIEMIRMCDEEIEAHVKICIPFDHENFIAGQVKSTGCTGGITSKYKKLTAIETSNMYISSDRIFDLMKKLYSSAENYQNTGGVHAAGMSFTGDKLDYFAEDVGRHNSIDKLAGQCLFNNNQRKGGIILTTGRVSSDMVEKAVRLQASIIVSRTSLTTLSYKIAQDLGITCVGYTTSDRFKIYTHHDRIKVMNKTAEEELCN